MRDASVDLAISVQRLRSALTAGLTTALVELADAIWPPRCRLCGRHADDGLACADHVLPEGPPGARCGRCAGPLPAGVPTGRRCGACRRRPPGWTRLVALGDYRAQPALREWVLAFKHGGRVDLARPLAEALAVTVQHAGVVDPTRDLLVAVPLHLRRRIERGYDQAARLAEELERSTGVALVRALARRRDTPVQGAPGSRSRRANVEGAFRSRRRAARLVSGRRVWLVDDVVTSGATVAECARTLRRLGATRVGVLALARAAPGGAGRASSAGSAETDDPAAG